MKPVVKAFLVLVVMVIAAGAGVVAYVSTTGMSAREEPGVVETFLARNLRNLAIARRARELSNPIERAPEIIAAGRAHFADHCAVCHDNNGSGDTTFGRGMWPKPPDLREEETQALSDGELFYIIEHGIRFSGMPGFGTGSADGEKASWHLVHFIRHLPDVSAAELAEMEKLNPKRGPLVRLDDLRTANGNLRHQAVALPSCPDVPTVDLHPTAIRRQRSHLISS